MIWTASQNVARAPEGCLGEGMPGLELREVLLPEAQCAEGLG